MKHYITNTALAILLIVGIIIGAAGSEIIYSIFAAKVAPLCTFILGIALAWVSAMFLYEENADWIFNEK